MAPQLHVSPDTETLAHDLARAIVLAAKASVTEREIFTLILTGGATPEPAYRLLGTEYASEMPWDKTHLFWGDERAVPPDSEFSNFGMAQNAMIKRVPIPTANVHRIETEHGNPEAVAHRYDQHLRQFFRVFNVESFDLSLNGIGDDGHTASLFPGSDLLKESSGWAMAATAPDYVKDLPRERITLTLPVLNNARTVFMVAAGANKREILRAIAYGRKDAAERYPAARLRGTILTKLFTDREGIGEDGP